MLQTPVRAVPDQPALPRRIKTAFDLEGIEIPFPQQTVSHRGIPVAEGRG